MTKGSVEDVGIVEFLRARLDEDEAQALRSKADNAMNPNLRIPAGWINGVADRVLREVEAKRRIVDLHANWPVLVQGQPKYEMQPMDATNPDSVSFRASQQIAWLAGREYRERFGVEPPSAPMLRALATVYSDHPDYDPNWAM